MQLRVNSYSIRDIFSIGIDTRFFLLILPVFISAGKWYISGLFILILFAGFILFTDYRKVVFREFSVWIWILLWSFYILMKSPVIYQGIIYFDFNYPDKLYDAVSYFSGTVLVPFMIFTIVTNVVLDEEFMNQLFEIFNICAIGLSFYSIYQFISIGGIITDKIRIAGFWGDLNIISAFLGIIFLFNLAFVTNRLRNEKIVLKLVTMLIVLIPIYLSQTRAVWLSMIFVLFFYGLRKPKVLLISIIMIGITSVIFWKLIVYKLLTVVYFQYDISTIGRLQAWYTSLLILKDNFLFGNGFDSFFYLKDDYFSGFLVFVPHSHNTYLRSLVETGLIGAIPVYYLFFSTFIKTYKMSSSDDLFYRKYGTAFTLMFITLSIVFIFEPFFSLYSNSSTFIWFFIALAYQLNIQRNDLISGVT